MILAELRKCIKLCGGSPSGAKSSELKRQRTRVPKANFDKFKLLRTGRGFTDEKLTRSMSRTSLPSPQSQLGGAFEKLSQLTP